MKKEDIINRLDTLLTVKADGSATMEGHELMAGTLSLLSVVYGRDSIQVGNFQTELNSVRATRHPNHYAAYGARASLSSLRMLRGEIDADILGDLERTISGDVLTDFLKLAREALSEDGDSAKNVASVLAAALFEDTIRRLASTSGIPHIDKLETTIGELKKADILKGSAVGIAQGYLQFRNNALHAKWEKVDRPEINSVLSFAEGLLLKHFS